MKQGNLIVCLTISSRANISVRKCLQYIPVQYINSVYLFLSSMKNILKDECICATENTLLDVTHISHNMYSKRTLTNFWSHQNVSF
jgi:hypothetical protein